MRPTVVRDDICTATGGRICATRVTFADGRTVRLLERIGKREAIRQAIEYFATPQK
jgi:hypothetical protein